MNYLQYFIGAAAAFLTAWLIFEATAQFAEWKRDRR